MHLLGRFLLAVALLAATVAGAREPRAAAPAPPQPSATPAAPPADFVPSERVPADAEVPFPVDI